MAFSVFLILNPAAITTFTVLIFLCTSTIYLDKIHVLRRVNHVGFHDWVTAHIIIGIFCSR